MYNVHAVGAGSDDRLHRVSHDLLRRVLLLQNFVPAPVAGNLGDAIVQIERQHFGRGDGGGGASFFLVVVATRIPLLSRPVLLVDQARFVVALIVPRRQPSGAQGDGT